MLERIGIQIADDYFLNLLEDAGARVDRKNKRVRFEPSWLDEHLKQAPPQVTLYSRDNQNDVQLGNGNVHFTNGGRVFLFRDGKTGQYRYTMLRHVARTAALTDKLNHISFYVIACQAHTIKPEVYHLNDFFHSFNNTTKHVMGGCNDIDGAKQVWELASFIAGRTGITLDS